MRAGLLRRVAHQATSAVRGGRLRRLWLGGGQGVALVGASVIACTILVLSVDGHYPLKHWLFFRYATYWALGAALFAGMMTAGFQLSGLLFWRTWLPPGERLLYSSALGVLACYSAISICGFLGLLGPTLFFVLPLALLACRPFAFGAYLRKVLRGRRRANEVWRRSQGASSLALTKLVVAFGLLSLLLCYLPILAPDNAAYDARWYHLAMAEQYVAEGAIRPFVEGWYVGTYPHLATMFYCWAFLLPGAQLFDQVELSAHVEFLFFLCTLPGLVVLARRLGAKSGKLAWAVFFLFPGIFVYDSHLTLGADHVAAFWVCPLWLALLRVFKHDKVADWVLLALVASGCLLTKYTAVSAVVSACLIVGVRALYQLVRAAAARLLGRPGGSVAALLKGPVAATATGLVMTSPHWLKNAIFYHNPLYPYAHDWFPSRPWSSHNAEYMDRWVSTHEWAPRGTLAERLEETLPVLYKFSFEPNDWPAFHGNLPVLGFLFTLSLLFLPWLRLRRRLWVFAAAVHVAVFLWYWSMHQDRYLQVLVPWMAVTVAVVFEAVWRRGLLGRLALVPLVGLQVVWGSTAVLIPSHAMHSGGVLTSSLALLGSGYSKDYETRLKIYEPYRSIGLALKDGDRVLLHEIHLRTGLRVPVVSDIFQGGFDYGSMGTPQGVREWAEAQGLTHVIWQSNSVAAESLANDLLFHDFVHLYVKDTQRFGHLNLGRIGPPGPPPPSPLLVAYLACETHFTKGLYALASLDIPVNSPLTKAEYPAPLLALGPQAGTSVNDVTRQARYVVFDPSCHPALSTSTRRTFEKLMTRGGIQYWVRKNDGVRPYSN